MPATTPDQPMVLTSPAFQNGGQIPTKYTGDGKDVSPALQWKGASDLTVEFALIVDDPDAPVAEPWVHWVSCKIPKGTVGLPEAVPRDARLKSPAGAIQGRNTWPSNNIGYRGPSPPKGHGVHHYHFKLYALSAPIQVEPGFDKKALLKAMEGKIVAQCELVGTYQR